MLLGLFWFTACSGPSNVATIVGANRLAELSNGELLVGTVAGELWLVSRYGDVRLLAHVEGVRDLVTDPVGRYWALAQDGTVFQGGIWVDPSAVGEDAALLVRTCEDTVWHGKAARPGVTVVDLGRSCESFVEGTVDGTVAGRPVSRAEITRVQTAGEGTLWVDQAGGAGCLGCALPVPATNVVDARALHVPPFLNGEVAWIDREGAIWIAGG